MFAEGVLASANIVKIKEGEQLLESDSFVFIALPLKEDAEPGAERERIPSVSRTTTDSLGPALANITQVDLERALIALERLGIPWR